MNVEVVLWLEEDKPPQYEATRKRMQAKERMLSQRLKQKLSWLTNRVFVCSVLDNEYKESLDVSFL